jgi:hypothetical protein
MSYVAPAPGLRPSGSLHDFGSDDAFPRDATKSLASDSIFFDERDVTTVGTSTDDLRISTDDPRIYTDPLTNIEIVKTILCLQRRAFFYFVPEMFYFSEMLHVYYNS